MGAAACGGVRTLSLRSDERGGCRRPQHAWDGEEGPSSPACTSSTRASSPGGQIFALPDLPHARKKHINHLHGTRVEDGPERVLLVSDVESTLNIIGKQQDIQGVRARAVMLALHHSYPY